MKTNLRVGQVYYLPPKCIKPTQGFQLINISVFLKIPVRSYNAESIGNGMSKMAPLCYSKITETKGV